MIYLLKMVIFHSYVDLPEGNTPDVFHPGYKQKKLQFVDPGNCGIMLGDI